MNSWDDDSSGLLQIVPAHVLRSNASNLSLANVPREQPRESSFLMQHSSKPGTWDKRLITMRQDGQLVAAKPHKQSETTNIGHLTDFDIYNPTARFASKMLKPPKKICYAIKSQQKSNIFQQDAKSAYVHFFCTSDETLATSFHDAVQSWRSWYLHHMKDEGKRKSSSGLGRSSSKATKQSKQSSHAQQLSTGSMDAHYQLGSYKPLGDLEKFDRPSSSRAKIPLLVLLLGSLLCESAQVIPLFYPNSRNWRMTNLLANWLGTEDLLSTKVRRRRHSTETVCSAGATLPVKRPPQNVKPLLRIHGLLVLLC